VPGLPRLHPGRHHVITVATLRDVIGPQITLSPHRSGGYLVAEFGLETAPLLAAAGDAGNSGSGGVIWVSHTIEFINVAMR
jgi:hypothetical protein